MVKLDIADIMKLTENSQKISDYYMDYTDIH